MIRFISSILTEHLERKPVFGYFYATIPTATGFWALVESATKLVGLVSVIIGLIVGIYTLRIQKRNWDQATKK